MAGIEVTGKYNNKVIYGTTVLVDLTSDTVTESTLAKGTTAHDKTGASIIGTLTVPTEQSKTVDLAMASGNQIVTPDSGKTLSQVTVTKPTTMVPENIKKDINIGGVVGTLESSGVSIEDNTYIISKTIILPQSIIDGEDSIEYAVNFTSNGASFTSLTIDVIDGRNCNISYGTQRVGTAYWNDSNEYGCATTRYNDEAYRKIVITDTISTDFDNWLYYSAVKLNDLF